VVEINFQIRRSDQAHFAKLPSNDVRVRGAAAGSAKSALDMRFAASESKAIAPLAMPMLATWTGLSDSNVGSTKGRTRPLRKSSMCEITQPRHALDALWP